MILVEINIVILPRQYIYTHKQFVHAIFMRGVFDAIFLLKPVPANRVGKAINRWPDARDTLQFAVRPYQGSKKNMSWTDVTNEHLCIC